jgi:hypothetical protein
MRNLKLVIALTCGFLVGLGTAHLKLVPVSAATPPEAVRGQSFVLTDAQGYSVATFRVGSRRSVVLIDESGNEIWRAPVRPRVQPLSER